MSECVFCKIANGEISSKKVFEDDNFFAIKDIHPISEGHALVISKKHFETILDFPISMGPELISTIKEVSLKVMKEVGATGFNIVQNNFPDSGQLVPHLHFHIIPRKKDDGVKLN
ncbi:MAG: HIT domain-containing protein [Nanoarchaeota archaeon]|nr:HIT domain-containing protein [Nanoarchaeota archaeon]